MINSATLLTGKSLFTTRTLKERATSATGAKSLKVSNGIFAFRLGFTAKAGVAMSSVYPSGSLPATTPVPMMVPAPGRLSTITFWPRSFDISSARMRAMVSVPPPGAKGTTSRIGLSG